MTLAGLVKITVLIIIIIYYYYYYYYHYIIYLSFYIYYTFIIFKTNKNSVLLQLRKINYQIVIFFYFFNSTKIGIPGFTFMYYKLYQKKLMPLKSF